MVSFRKTCMRVSSWDPVDMGNIGLPMEAVLSSFFQKSFLNVLSLAIKSKIFPLICEKEDEERSPLPHYIEGAVKVKFTQLCLTLRPHRLYSTWNSPGQNTGEGSFSLLQGIFPIQRSYPGLLHCRQILYQLSHKGSPRILEWVAYLFSSRSSQPRNQTGVSWIAGRFLTNWDIKEAPRRGKIPSIIHQGQWPNEDHRQQRKGSAFC